jgi:hypothetical protein
MTAAAAAPDLAALRAMLKSQYHAALAMLRDAVERCPDAVWEGGGYTNACWQQAYHALFFAQCYSRRDSETFLWWPGHRTDTMNPDAIPGPPDPDAPLPHMPPPYSKDQVLAACRFVDEGIDAAIDAMDLGAAESGFPWYPIPKLEHQIVNLRHIQHHTAQIADRVRTHAGEGVRWVGARRPR